MNTWDKIRNKVIQTTNTAGTYWKKAKDALNTLYTTTALDEYGRPIIQADNTLATRTSSPSRDIAVATSLVALPVSAVTAGAAATAGGIVGGIAADKVTQAVIKPLVKNSDQLTEEGKEFITEAPGLIAGFIGGTKGAKIGKGYSDLGTGYAESIADAVVDATKPIETTQAVTGRDFWIERPAARITEAERAGLPKSERTPVRSSNGKVKLKRAVDTEGKNIQSFDIVDAPVQGTPKQGQFINTPIRKNSLQKIPDSFTEAVQQYANYEIRPEITDLTVREFHNHYGNLGYDTSSLSDDIIKRMLSAQFDELSSIQTNPSLQGKLLWHSSPTMFSEVNPDLGIAMSHGKTPYFMTTTDSPAYGYGMLNSSKMTALRQAITKQVSQLHPEWFQEIDGTLRFMPEFRQQAQSQINSLYDQKIAEILQYGGQGYSVNNQPYLVSNKGFKGLVNADLENMVSPNGDFLQLPWTSAEPSVGSQVGIPLKGSVIKSLYPSPELATPFGFISRDLTSPNINFKYGGKLNYLNYVN